MKKAIIAMSGGVDSSVAAFITMQQGYCCEGAIMKLCDKPSQEQDIRDAQTVCDRLGIPLHVFDMREEFKKNVIANFISEYERGATPNPCIQCNRTMKFGLFWDQANNLGADYIVTGHYAQIAQDKTGRYLLKKAVDRTKDQTYVLYTLTQRQLQHTLFPLGTMSKQDVRNIAKEQGFLNAGKHDSQDICFIPDGDYAGFIQAHTKNGSVPGDFITKDGKILGRHKGLIHYTIGQRKGLGLALPHPMYVCALDTEKNTVILGENEDLFTKEFQADNLNLIATDAIKDNLRVQVKTRYSQISQAATVTQTNDILYIRTDAPLRAPTAGQAVVLYDADTVIGGGRII